MTSTPPPAWFIIILLAGVAVMGMMVLAKKIKEMVQARAAAKEKALRDAQDASKDNAIMMGIARGFIDPLGLVI